MSILHRFIGSVAGITMLLIFGLLATVATPAAVPINSFYGNWSSTVTYPRGSVVTSGGSSYISLLGSSTNPNVNHSPLTSSKWWAPLAAQGTQGIPGATGPRGGMVVKDANGTVVGPYIFTAYDNESVAVQTSAGLLIFGLTYSSTSATGEPLLRLTSDHFIHLFYTTNDCTGPAYLDATQLNVVDLYYFRYQLISGTNFYPMPPPNSAVTTIVKGSESRINTCVPASSGGISVVPLTNGTPLSTLGFVAPFTIRLN